MLNLFRRAKPAKQRILLESASEEIWGNPLVAQCYLQMSLGRRDIETTVQDPELARRLMARVIEQWRALSADEPYWCNDTQARNKAAVIDETAIQAFYDDGDVFMSYVAAFESRNGVALGRGTCVELGAGVGKHTHLLAKRFDRVIAVDVSARLLSISGERMKAFGHDNIDYLVLQSPDDLAKLGPIDVFVAYSVLAHNPPPIQRMLLENAMGRLKSGGFVLFQTPDWFDRYSFSTKRFLDDPPDAMCDSHCFPKQLVIEMLKTNGMDFLDFAPDFTNECFGSYTYFARKL